MMYPAQRRVKWITNYRVVCLVCIEFYLFVVSLARPLSCRTSTSAKPAGPGKRLRRRSAVFTRVTFRPMPPLLSWRTISSLIALQHRRSSFSRRRAAPTAQNLRNSWAPWPSRITSTSSATWTIVAMSPRPWNARQVSRPPPIFTSEESMWAAMILFSSFIRTANSSPCLSMPAFNSQSRPR